RAALPGRFGGADKRRIASRTAAIGLQDEREVAHAALAEALLEHVEAALGVRARNAEAVRQQRADLGRRIPAKEEEHQPAGKHLLAVPDYKAGPAPHNNSMLAPVPFSQVSEGEAEKRLRMRFRPPHILAALLVAAALIVPTAAHAASSGCAA